MKQYPIATPAQRGAAGLINMVVGGLPVVIPTMMFPPSAELASWSAAEVNLLAAALAAIQLVFVHRMQGSPGAVFAGLRVQALDGSRPTIAVTLARSLPFLLLGTVTMAKRTVGTAREVDPLSFIAALCLFFVALSGVTLLIKRRLSLVDLLTKTTVVKSLG